MKTILTICIGIFLPHFLFCQNQITLQNSLNPLSIPYLFAEKKNTTNPKFISLSNYYANFNNYINKSNSVLPIKQKLDSIINVPADTTIASSKISYTYNMDGQITSKTEYQWNVLAQKWFNISKTEWNYDAKRNNINYIVYYGDNDDINWYTELKYENTFDANNKLLKTEGFGWDDTNSQWVIGIKFENIYDNEDLTSLIYSEWDGPNSQLIPVSKFEYEYTSGFLTMTIQYEWQGNWVNLNKGVFVNYLSGKVFTYTFYIWDGFSIWTESFKSETQINSDQKVTFYYEYLWDLIGVIFVNSKKTEYKYDSEGNVFQAVFSKWVKQLQGFILEAKEDCLYNNQYTYADLLLNSNLKFSQTTIDIPDNEVYFNHMLNKYTYSLHNGTIYIKDNSKTFYYSPIVVTQTHNQTKSTLRITPNPADSYFSIDMVNTTSVMDFTLLDLNGKLKISKKINSNEKISTESLSKGMYLYKIISNNNKLSSGKLIVN